MADEDKDKAEKLAAAKKRFEQLKKEQKKGKKGGKKKSDKEGADNKVDEAVEEELGTTSTEQPVEEASGGDADGGAAAAEPEDADDAEAQTPSLSQQSQQRSQSFRQGTEDLYRKQAARIEELEKENSALKGQQAEGAGRLARVEEELESLRESSSDIAEVRTKAKETDRLTSELSSVQRQLSQAQQAAKGRRQSSATPDVSAQLASKTSAIESLELDISNLRNNITSLESRLASQDSSARDLEERATAAETTSRSLQQELDALKVSISFPGDDSATDSPEALTKRISILESDLRTAATNLTSAQSRATSLEQKIEALTKLHKDATAASQAKEREASELRAQLRRQPAARVAHVRDASDFEPGDDVETETARLQARIRALEADNFDLRRGVWRDRRAELQPGMDDHDTAGGGEADPRYEDVDLDAPYGASAPSASSARPGAAVPRQTSTFQDVITSGINAFTGRSVVHPHHHQYPNPPATAAGAGIGNGRERAESMGLLDDDDDGNDFDADAFRRAQEEEARRRIERVKEVKRGLEGWRGWVLDLADLRRDAAAGVQGRDVGPVFEL